MADPDFFQKSDAQKTVDKHQQLQQDLEAAMEEWEEAQSKLDEAGIG